MTHIDIRSPHDLPRAGLSYQAASLLACEAAREGWMQAPTIVAWHRRSDRSVSPSFAGGDPEAWWVKYGEGNGGSLEVSVAGEYDFVMMDSGGYETTGELPLRSLADAAGTQYVCYTPLLGDSQTPTEAACMPLDDWWADQY